MAREEELERTVKQDNDSPVREGVKAVLEEVLGDDRTSEADYWELTPTRKDKRNGYYQRNLVTPESKIELLEVPCDREGEFVTEVFEC